MRFLIANFWTLLTWNEWFLLSSQNDCHTLDFHRRFVRDKQNTSVALPLFRRHLLEVSAYRITLLLSVRLKFSLLP